MSHTGVVQGFFPSGMARAATAQMLSRVPAAARHLNAVQLPAAAANFPTAGGQPLPAAVLQKMESVFGARFGDVRIHLTPQVSALGAIAMTQAPHIHFAPGRYDPFGPHGQQILRHELAHVVQQRAGRVRNPFGSGVALVQDAMLESEADRMSRRAPAPVLQPAKRSAAADLPGKSEKKPKLMKVDGKKAAAKIINWLIDNGYGGDSNYTVGVTQSDNLIIAKVNGVGAGDKAIRALKPVVEEEGWHKDRFIYLAKKFDTSVGSNHAEMCILAAMRGKLTYMLCTNDNCDFCSAALVTYGVPSGNPGGGKSQQGWSHPFYPLRYGTQISQVVTVQKQAQELARLSADPKESDVKIGSWGVTAPRTGTGNLKYWVDG